MHLDKETIKSHALDPENYGTRHPSRNFYFGNDAFHKPGLINNFAYVFKSIPEPTALLLNWDYAQVTGTDSNGEFEVQDASSGSLGINSGT